MQEIRSPIDLGLDPLHLLLVIFRFLQVILAQIVGAIDNTGRESGKDCLAELGR